MADEVTSTIGKPDHGSGEELSKLKRDLEGYREVILPFNKVLEWEQNHYPAILVGVITLVFAIVWYLEPSVLTAVCLFGLLLTITDFAVPTLSAYLFPSAEWTVVQERQYEAICTRLLNAKTHVVNLKKAILTMKAEKPKVYLLVMMGAFAVLAWLGNLMDNLLLTYLIVVGASLVPGLRKHGIIQKVTKQAMDAVSGLRGGAAKPKTN